MINTHFFLQWDKHLQGGNRQAKKQRTTTETPRLNEITQSNPTSKYKPIKKQLTQNSDVVVLFILEIRKSKNADISQKN